MVNVNLDKINIVHFSSFIKKFAAIPFFLSIMAKYYVNTIM